MTGDRDEGLKSEADEKEKEKAVWVNFLYAPILLIIIAVFLLIELL